GARRRRAGAAPARRQPRHPEAGGAGSDGHDVVAGSAVHDHGVRLAVAPVRGAFQVDVHLEDISAGQIVHGDRVGPAQGVQVNALDVVEVHDDVTEVAGELHALAVGRDIKDLADPVAVEN